MSRDALKTLFHPFAIRQLTSPARDERVLFLGAEAGLDRPEGFDAEIAAVQAFRPLYTRLIEEGSSAQPFPEGSDYDFVLILMSRHRGENERYLAEALERCREGGRIVVAGGKDDGVQSLRKRVAALGIDVEHLAKYHGQAFWFTRPAEAGLLAQGLRPADAIVEAKFVTRAGMFSHGEADPGSAFLARYLPSGFGRLAADFGAGWGYLSAALYEKSPSLEGIDLYEADYNALEAARSNLNRLAPGLSARYYWHDLVREDVRHRYELVVMNPPFHEGHAAEPMLGQAMIAAAAHALKAGGELMMVANRGLPYEQVLAQSFKTSGERARNARFKVLVARK